MADLDRLLELEQEKELELQVVVTQLQGLKSKIQALETAFDTLRADLAGIKAVKKMLRAAESHSLMDAYDRETVDLWCDAAPINADSNQAIGQEFKRPEGSPGSWLYPQYRHLSLVNAAKAILEEMFPKFLSNSEITTLLYNVEEDSEEFTRARNSVAASLRRGADAGLFQKVGRGYFQAHPPEAEVD